MRGHEPLIAMRKAGKGPDTVFLDDFPSPVARDWHDPGRRYGEKWPNDLATVELAQDDDPATLDLGFVAGMRVHISSMQEGRAKALSRRCKECGAIWVGSNHIQPASGQNCQEGWMEIWRQETPNG